jgi:hypothetical protein
MHLARLRVAAASAARVVIRSLLLLLAAAVPAGAAEPLALELENGIAATLYPPDYVLQNMTVRRDGETILEVDGYQYRLVTDISDPIIVNKGDGRFHPMALDEIAAALRAVRIQSAGIRVRILVLPYPRREVLDSSARGDVILLSPGVLELSAQTVHFTVTHEIGHIYQYRWMPDAAVADWQTYAEMRGIADRAVYNAAAAHMNRPHEVFAEDFRFFFGDRLSNAGGTIENPDLAVPTAVTGLEEFVLGLRESRRAAAARLFPVPNPFNPSTEIRVQFEEERTRDVRVGVFDAQGRLVRRLWNGLVSVRELRLPWDGRGDAGTPAGSGVYFARLEYDGTATTTKLLLVK